MLKLKVFALFIMIILVALITICIGQVDRGREVIPPNPKGFIGYWHPAPECGQCHVSLLSDRELVAKLGSCNCHREAYTTGGAIDTDKISKTAHGTKICVDCHIGTGMVNITQEIPGDKYHKIHQETDCQKCHGKRENIALPAGKNCDSCHISNPHTVHGNKTGDMCVICHGPFGIQYKEEGYQLIEGVPLEKNQKETGEMTYPTISNILKALIEFIFKPKEAGGA
jgi:hypothetical protein